MFVFLFFPFGLKPCGFSRPGNFYDTFTTEGTGGARQAWQAKKYGIPDLTQIAEGCRIFSRSQASGGRLPPSPPAVTLWRKINGRESHGSTNGRIPMLAHRDSRIAKNCPIVKWQ